MVTSIRLPLPFSMQGKRTKNIVQPGSSRKVMEQYNSLSFPHVVSDCRTTALAVDLMQVLSYTNVPKQRLQVVLPDMAKVAV